MILSRISKALREQNWTAVAIEFVIVIAGVVIGFQVTAWNGERAEMQREAAYLRQLDVELTTIVEELEGGEQEAAAYFRWVMLFLEGVRTGDPEMAQEGSWGLNAITEVVWVNMEPAALTELISAGELGLISNRDLRTSLASIPALENDSRSRSDQMAARLAPVAGEIARHFQAQLENLVDASNPNYTTETLQFDFETVAQDEQLLSRINYAALQNRFQITHLMRRGDQFEAIRDQVRAEIAARGLE